MSVNLNDNYNSALLEIEPERYELSAGPIYRFELDRRELFKILGCGLLLLLTAPDVTAAQESGRGRGGFGGGQAPRELGAWLHIGEDGHITGFTGKVEVGQNARTSLTQVVAEEIRAPMGSISLVMGDTDLTPYDAGTFGSRTTPTMAPEMRRAGAAARELLIDMAAELWKVDRATLTASDGKINDPHNARSVTYGQLTKGQNLVKSIEGNIPVTPVSEWKVEGTSAAKVDGQAIVTGRHKYTVDIRRPGMVYGKVLRAPAFRATLTSVDSQAAAAMTGVSVVRDGEFVGVTAPNSYVAGQAIASIKAEWKTTPQLAMADLYTSLKQGAPPEGNPAVDAALAAANKKLETTYTVAYIAHAPLEPRAAVAEWEGDKLTVWTGSQRPFGVRSELAQAFRIPEEKVRVIVPDTGSGYGGKHTGEAAVEAARLAKSAGKPVKLIWTREEEFTWAYFRPAGVMDVRSGVSADGVLQAWEFHNYNSGNSGLNSPYDIPVRSERFHQADYPLRQGSYRGLAGTANHFARECHMDEIARSLSIEPLAFRRKNLKDARMQAVLDAAAERFGWEKRRKTAPGRGFGIAGGTEKGSYVATCVEIAADRATGQVRILRAVTAFECGAVLNPDKLKNQVEGATVMAIGGALFESISFDNGKILNPRFSKYRVPRFGDVPAMEAVLVDRKDIPSAGAGETPIMALAPAVGNAIFDATGVRLRAMPMRLT